MAILDLGNDQKVIEIEGVVSDHPDEIWKVVPWKQNHIVSSHGRIAKQNPYGCYEIKTINITKTYKDYYYSVAGVTYGKNDGTTGVHRVVCRVFNGPPPDNDDKYDVNHKDGNKINNHYENLEWVTRSDNVHHAYQNGLSKVGVRVKATDINTNEIQEFNTLSEAARYFNLPRHEFKRLASFSYKYPLLNKYRIEIDHESDQQINRPQIDNKDVICRDYINNKLYITHSASEMGIITGINCTSIRLRLQKTEAQEKLLKGYLFRYIDDKRPWLTFTQEELDQERFIRELDEGKFRKRQVHLVKNLITHEILSFESISEGMRYIIDNIIHKIKMMDISRYISKYGYYIREQYIIKPDDNQPWPDISEEEIKLRLLGWDGRSRPIKVTDTLLNTTKTYISITRFAKELGINPDLLSSIIKQNETGLIYDRYKIAYVNTEFKTNGLPSVEILSPKLL